LVEKVNKQKHTSKHYYKINTIRL